MVSRAWRRLEGRHDARGSLPCGPDALKRFARLLKGYLPGILAHCRWPLSTSLVEGMNNKIKVIKRMAYGFRDDAYFFLKIRAAVPGIAR
jgi:transposase